MQRVRFPAHGEDSVVEESSFTLSEVCHSTREENLPFSKQTSFELTCFMSLALSPLDVVVCQSVARRRSSKKKVDLVRSELRINAATVIQANWRAYSAMQKFGKTKSRILKSQATVRTWLAVRRLKLLSQQVSFALRRYYGDLGCNYVTAVGRSSCKIRIASLVHIFS